MEWELVKPWVNRVGIVLEFLSFWFAAPEILGEERLRKMELGVELGVILLPILVMVASVMSLIWLIIAAATVFRQPLEAVLAQAQEVSGRWWVVEVVAATVALAAAVAAGRHVKAVLARRVEAITGVVLPRELYVFPVTVAMLAVALAAVSVALPERRMLEVMLGLYAAAVMAGLTPAMAIAIVLNLAFRLYEKRLLSPLLRVLANDKRIRQRSLAGGAVLFVVGFLLQLVATF